MFPLAVRAIDFYCISNGREQMKDNRISSLYICYIYKTNSPCESLLNKR